MKPDFYIIGAQKCATSWLWNMLDQHPGTSLPARKETHYFSYSEYQSKGEEWYFDFFKNVDPEKITGEASTTYLYDRVSYLWPPSPRLKIDESFPLIPQMISQRFPEAKIIILLRDPVRRALSAYMHIMRKKNVSPLTGFQNVIENHTKYCIVEYGFYEKYLELWNNYFPENKMHVIIYEDQVIKNYDRTIYDVYSYLGLDPSFRPENQTTKIYKSWGWTRIFFHYYLRKITQKGANSKVGAYFDDVDFLRNHAITVKDIEYLRSIYLSRKDKISELLNNNLDCWDYGVDLL